MGCPVPMNHWWAMLPLLPTLLGMFGYLCHFLVSTCRALRGSKLSHFCLGGTRVGPAGPVGLSERSPTRTFQSGGTSPPRIRRLAAARRRIAKLNREAATGYGAQCPRAIYYVLCLIFFPLRYKVGVSGANPNICSILSVSWFWLFVMRRR
jgi:hypothetical protein